MFPMEIHRSHLVIRGLGKCSDTHGLEYVLKCEKRRITITFFEKMFLAFYLLRPVMEIKRILTWSVDNSYVGAMETSEFNSRTSPCVKYFKSFTNSLASRTSRYF